MRVDGCITVREHARHFNEGLAVRGASSTAWQMVAALVEQKGWKKQKFCNMTLLDEDFYNRAMSNHKKKPGLRTLMAFCAGADLPDRPGGRRRGRRQLPGGRRHDARRGRQQRHRRLHDQAAREACSRTRASPRRAARRSGAPTW